MDINVVKHSIIYVLKVILTGYDSSRVHQVGGYNILKYFKIIGILEKNNSKTNI